jgi:hypothetical protein
MNARTLPVVLVPRFTTFAGQRDFATVGLDVSAFSGGTVAVWRGAIVGGVGFGVNFEESPNQDTWTVCNGTVSSMDPGIATEVSYTFELRTRYLRLVVSLTGADAVVTAYAAGYLIPRQK